MKRVDLTRNETTLIVVVALFNIVLTGACLQGGFCYLALSTGFIAIGLIVWVLYSLEDCYDG